MLARQNVSHWHEHARSARELSEHPRPAKQAMSTPTALSITAKKCAVHVSLGGGRRVWGIVIKIEV